MITRQRLWKASPNNVLRLARWLGMEKDNCTCTDCMIKVIEWVARRCEE